MSEIELLKFVGSLGSPASLGLLFVAVITLIKTWPIIQKQVLDITNSREGRYGERIKHLEAEVEKCHRECAEHKRELAATIDGLKAQRISEQIAMMRAILRTIDDANLRKQLEMLEALQMTTETITHVGGPVRDGGK